jgi:hypothetical protein
VVDEVAQHVMDDIRPEHPHEAGVEEDTAAPSTRTRRDQEIGLWLDRDPTVTAGG